MDLFSILDARTLAVLSGVFRFCAGLIVIAFQSQIDTPVAARNRPVQAIWGIGSIIIGLGITLIGLRAIVPDFASINVGNTFVLLGATTTTFAYSIYSNTPRLRSAAVVIGVLGAVLFNLVDASVLPYRVELRSGITLCTLALFQIIIVVSLLRAPRKGSRLLRFLVFGHAVSIVPTCMRLYEVMFWEHAQIIAPTIGVVALFLGASMFSFMIVPTFILLLKEDSDRDLITKEREIARREAALEAAAGLKQHRVRAEESERVAQLARGIAHDFNNLLSMIKFGLRQIEDSLGTRTQEKLHKTTFDTIYRSLEQGITTTTGLMSLGLEQKVVWGQISITEALEDLRYLTGSRLPRSIRQEYDLDAAFDLCAISNGPLLNMCLMNLVLNARDAMPSGGTLQITARIVEWTGTPQLLVGQLMPDTYVQIDISDTGSGISSDQIEHIFDAEFSQTRSRKGTGLGLFMVRQFFEKTGSGLYLRSEPSVGTTVSLLLPHLSGCNDQVASVALDDVNVTVLIVDDDLRTRKSLQRLFIELGEIAAVAADGQEALAQLDSFPNLTLVLTDFGMPGLDGIELMQEMHMRRADLPVVIMTNTNIDDFPEEIREGCLILQKPLGLNELRKLKSNLLSGSHGDTLGKGA